MDLLRFPTGGCGCPQPLSGGSLAPTSAKLEKNKPNVYRYYAGYSADFVREILGRTVSAGATILDPWNGAGTTTAVAASLGHDAVGIDVNPAMIVMAVARLAAPGDWAAVASALPRRWSRTNDRTDVLQRWLTPPTAEALRGFERHILRVLGADEHTWPYDAPQQLTATQSVATLTIAILTRRLLAPFQTSNPTWLRLRVQPNERISASLDDIRRAALDILAKGHEFGLGEIASTAKPPQLILANCEDALLRTSPEAYDLVISSPPYCTRLDYVIATLPELAAMGIPSWNEVEQLRLTMLGGPSRNADTDPSETGQLSASARTFLETVKNHPSKAASAYYYRFYSRYLVRYARTIKRIATCTKRGGRIVLVVQDSHFKDLSVPLSEWTREALAEAGARVENEWGYAVPNPKALNPAGKRYRASNATVESIVMARKDTPP